MRLPETESRPCTALHRASPRVKLVAALMLVALTALLPRRLGPVYFAPAAVLGGLWLASRMPLLYGLRRLLLAQTFILGIALLCLFSPSARPGFPATVTKAIFASWPCWCWAGPRLSLNFSRPCAGCAFQQ